ncbi:MAG: hypothetical protein WAZ77_14165 [Candidatus Nitrosopolaris sp.]
MNQVASAAQINGYQHDSYLKRPIFLFFVRDDDWIAVGLPALAEPTITPMIH